MQKKKSNDIEILDVLSHAIKHDKKQLDQLCAEFDILNPKSHNNKLSEYTDTQK